MVLAFIEYLEEARSTTLHSFDMDETLFSHDPKKLRVHVRDHTGKLVRSLTNQQFNKYKLKPNENFDFKSFKSARVFNQSAKPIHKMIDRLNKLHHNGHKVEILTARSDLDDKQSFSRKLKKSGIDINKIHVRRAGNTEGTSTGDRKRRVLSGLIRQHGYREVHLYDDDLGNHAHFAKLKQDHPAVRLFSHVVHHNEHTGQTTVRTIRH